jgi:hypothetical protein
MVDLRHPLAVLASRMPWPQIEAALAPAFAHKDRKGRAVKGAGMFGPALSVAGAPEFDTNTRKPLILLSRAQKLALQQLHLGVGRWLLELQCGQHGGLFGADGGHAGDRRAVVDGDGLTLDAAQHRQGRLG